MLKLPVLWMILMALHHTLLRATALAPGDEDAFCTSPSILVVPHVIPPNITVLMDSHNYNNLLPNIGLPESNVWQEVGMDTSQQTKWLLIFQTPCRHLLSSCSYFELPTQKNWIVTQLISKSTPANTLLSRVNVLVEFELDECVSNCQASFTLSMWETSSINRTAARNISQYVPVQEIVPSNYNKISNVTIPINFVSNETGFHLAFVISNTCIRMSRIMAFYYVCPSTVLDLVEYQQTVAPAIHSQRVQVKGHCVKGASKRTSRNSFLHCSQGGDWISLQNETRCHCNQGYVISSNQSACLACPAGQYLSSNTSFNCISCPLNTRVDESAVTECQCASGYFRAPHEVAASPCTPQPSKCTNLRVISASETTLFVQWNRPNITGRPDFYYKIFYRDLSNSGDFIIVTDKFVNTSYEVEYEIMDLSPSQNYQIRVSTRNGVSDQDPNQLFRWCDVQASTLQAGFPSECRNLVVTSISDRDVVIQWNQPSTIGERYFYYKVLYSDLNRPGQFLMHNSSLVNFNSVITYQVTNLIPFQMYQIRVTTHNNFSDMNSGQVSPKYCEVRTSTRKAVPDQVTKVKAFCSVIVWENPSLIRGDILHYQLLIQPQRKTLIVTYPFYITSEEERSSDTTVQIQAVNGVGEGPYSYPLSIGCQDVSTTCQDSATPSPPSNSNNYLHFELNGKSYLNDTVVVMEDIGEGLDALLCYSTYNSCCYSGEFFYPNGSAIPIGSHGSDLYRNRGKGLGFIRLNRRRNVTSPEGRYRCLVPIGNGLNQSLFINIVSRRCSDPSSLCPPCASCPPATPTSCPTCTPSAPCPQTVTDSTTNLVTTSLTSQAPPTTFDLTPSAIPTLTPEVTTLMEETTPPIVTTDRPPVLYFELKGQVYSNNSVINMVDIGEHEDALRCVSEDNPLCCGKAGDFYYPNGTRIPSQRDNHAMWRNRGQAVNQPFVRLHRRPNRSPISGVFRCEIPYVDIPRQRLYITVI